MKKEIFFVSTQYIPTGASVNRLFAFAKSLNERGIKVHFFYLIPDTNKSHSERYTDKFEFHYLWDGFPVNNRYLCAFLSIHKLRKYLRLEIPVYVYGSLNFFPFIGKSKKIRLYHEYTENPNTVGVINNIIGRYLFKRYKHAVKRCDGLFVITPSLKDYYVKTTGIPKEKVIVLNMVVDPNRFNGMEQIEPQKRISYCGTISEQKDGILYLLKAFSIISKDFPNYYLYIIGKYESETTAYRVKKLVKTLDIGERVVFTGPIPPEQMPALLKQSQVLALARPKQREEAFGFATKIGEYLMTERPVVMTNVGNVTDFLTDKENVLLAEPNNAEDFSEKLRWALTHEDEAREIGKNGKIIAFQSFNANNEAEKIYNTIWGDRH